MQGEARLNTGINPLRETTSIRWFKQRERTTHPSYVHTLEEKRKLHELDQLFRKFNEDGSGVMQLSELHTMFSFAGVTLPEEEIESLFFRASQKEHTTKSNRFRSAESLRYKLNLGVEDLDFKPTKASSVLGKKNIKISKQAPVKFEDFKAVMLSEEANDRFKYMIKRVRAQIRKGNFDNVKTDI